MIIVATSDNTEHGGTDQRTTPSQKKDMVQAHQMMVPGYLYMGIYMLHISVLPLIIKFYLSDRYGMLDVVAGGRTGPRTTAAHLYLEYRVPYHRVCACLACLDRRRVVVVVLMVIDDACGAN